MPVSHLLEGVAGAQNQRFFHMPSNNLEPNRKAIGGLAAGQCQRWMPAHIKRRGEGCVPPLRPEPSASDISQGWCSAVHGGHDEQVDIAEEGIELPRLGDARSWPPQARRGHGRPVR